MKGFDVSKWQSTINFRLAVKTGYDFVIIRACNGLTEDEKFQLHINEALAAGLQVGVYQYHSSSVSAAKQAQFLEKLTRPWRNEIFMYAFDMEHKSATKTQNDHDLLLWENGMRRLGISSLYLYTNEWLYNHNFSKGVSSRMKLWIAKYSAKAPSVGELVTIWQYTSSADKSDFYKKPLDRDIICDKEFQFGNSTDDKEYSPEDLVIPIFNNEYGTGEQRFAALKALGFNPTEVQKYVNFYYKVALDTIAGLYGNEPKRSKKWEEKGINPKIAQAVVNAVYR